MKRHLVILRTPPSDEVDFPPDLGGRATFGALRLHPGVQTAVSESELRFMESKRPDLMKRLHISPYVESRRVDRRGYTEAEVDRAAAEAGIPVQTPFAIKVKLLLKT